jgi:hypothetical protein
VIVDENTKQEKEKNIILSYQGTRVAKVNENGLHILHGSKGLGDNCKSVTVEKETDEIGSDGFKVKKPIGINFVL